MHSSLGRLAVFIFAFSLAVPAFSQEPVADVDLNQQNVALWRDFILPSQDELDFMKIPWRRTFKDGIVDAKQLDRPVLLWTMNGHPLGCT